MSSVLWLCAHIRVRQQNARRSPAHDAASAAEHTANQQKTGFSLAIAILSCTALASTIARAPVAAGACVAAVARTTRRTRPPDPASLVTNADCPVASADVAGTSVSVSYAQGVCGSVSQVGLQLASKEVNGPHIPGAGDGNSSRALRCEDRGECFGDTVVSNLFDKLGSYEQIYDTVRKRLEEIWADERTHRDLNLDPECAFSTHFPMPFFRAAETVALKNGWHLESFLLSLMNNVPFLEHRATRLTPTAGKHIQELQEVPEITSSAPPPSEVERPKKKMKKGDDAHSDDDEAKEAQDAALQAWLQKSNEMYGSDSLLHVHAGDYVHQISPGIPVILAGPASSRKSSQCEFTTSLIQAKEVFSFTFAQFHLFRGR